MKITRAVLRADVNEELQNSEIVDVGWCSQISFPGNGCGVLSYSPVTTGESDVLCQDNLLSKGMLTISFF